MLTLMADGGVGFAGSNAHTFPRCVLCVYVFPGNTHFLHDSPPCALLFWLSGDWTRVRNARCISISSGLISHPLARRLMFVLAFGVYASSFVKDLICSPRPFTPPVTRLSKFATRATNECVKTESPGLLFF